MKSAHNLFIRRFEIEIMFKLATTASLLLTSVSVSALSPWNAARDLLSLNNTALGVETVDVLELDAYVGLWYQMYADQLVYSTIEPDAQCVTAKYAIQDDGSVSVHNYQTTGSPDSGVDTIDGYATVPNAEEPGQLKVFFDTSPLGAPYWVLALGPKNEGGMYDYAIVSDPFSAYLFMLARDVDTFQQKYDESVLEQLDTLGFNKKFNSPIATYHGKDCVYEA